MFLVSIMSSTFHVSILNLNIIMNVHMTFLISTKLFKCEYIFETLFEILSKFFYRHLYIYLITINFLNFCLLFDIAHSIKLNLFFVVVVILIPTKIAVLAGSKFYKHMKNCLYNINFIVLHMLRKILCFTQLTLQKLIDVLFLIDYFLYIADRVFKFLMTGIFIICKQFFILFIIIFVVKLAFFNIFFINNVPLIVNQAKTIDGALPTTMGEDSLSYGKEGYISFSVTSKNTKHLDYTLRNYLILTLISFCVNIFSKNKGLRFTKLSFAIFVIFLCFCKISNNPIDSDLKTSSKTEFYTTESIKLQENLGNTNRNSTLAYFAISKQRSKSIHFRKFYQILILLSGDVNLNPGPSQMQLNDDKIWKPLITRGLHFCHLNVNSLLFKIDEIRDISNRIKPAVLSITESKLDSSVTNSEVNINGYSIIRNDRNRNGGGVAFYVRNDLCFNIKNVFSNSLEHVFFEILLPKVKPIAIGIFYRPPNVNNFLEILSNDF